MTFGLGRLGASFGKLGAGNSVGDSTPAFSLTAPVATWVSDPEVSQATFNIDADNRVVSGDKIWGESSLDNFATVLETVSAPIGAPDLIDFDIETFEFSPFADGLTYARFWVSNSANVQISPKSNIISETIVTSLFGGSTYQLLFAA